MDVIGGMRSYDQFLPVASYFLFLVLQKNNQDVILCMQKITKSGLAPPIKEVGNPYLKGDCVAESHTSHYSQALRTKMRENHRVVSMNYILLSLFSLLSSHILSPPSNLYLNMCKGLENENNVILTHENDENDDEPQGGSIAF